MVRYTLIVILAVLLGISSYLLYKGEYVVVNIETGTRGLNTEIVQGGTSDNQVSIESQETLPTSAKATQTPDMKEEVETLDDDSGTEIHLDPTVGVDINTDQRIASSYKVIGPKQFVLLTDNEEPMVEIDLDTGQVKIGPEYELDEVSTAFWKSIGKKYPEVCFIEKN